MNNSIYKILVLLNLLLFISTVAYAQPRLEKENVTCPGSEDGKADVIVDGIEGEIEYAWSHDSNLSDRRARNLKPGEYSVTVSTGGCQDVLFFKIFDKPPITNRFKETVIDSRRCDGTGEDKLRVDAFPGGGNGGFVSNWYKPATKTHWIETTVPSARVFAVKDSLNCRATFNWESDGFYTVCSNDPNDIVGPNGVREPRYMKKEEAYFYTVNFENDQEIATAPAQEVRISVQLDEKVNPFSLRIFSFGFANNSFQLDGSAAFYQQRLDLTSELGIFVDVTAGLNVNDNEAFWIFSSIDPLTGLAPLDPSIGMLPINDTLTGDGEGFVSFTVLPKATTQTGDTIAHQAEIIFDSNEGILTNTWKNTVDALPPTTSLDPLPASSDSARVHLSWSGSDDPGGSGLASYKLYVSIDDGPFQLVDSEIEETTFVYQAQFDANYAFYVLGVDSVRNCEEKTLAETSIYVMPQRELELLKPDQFAYCVFDTLNIEWLSAQLDSVLVEISIDSGSTFTAISTFSTDTTGAGIELIPSYISEEVVIKITGTNDTAFFDQSLVFAVKDLPNIMASEDVTGCASEPTLANVSGGNQYHWTPEEFVGNPTGASTFLFPPSDETFYVSGTDIYGCTNTDSIEFTTLPTFIDTAFYTLCEGDSVFVAGEWQTETGLYLETFTAQNGCDSFKLSVVSPLGPEDWEGGTIVYVDSSATGLNNGSSWTNAFNDLQDALCIAYSIDTVNTVWVANGTYTPSPHGARLMSFVIQDSIQIFGGFAGGETELVARDPALNPTRLSGDIGIREAASDNAFHVIRIDPASTNSLIDGFTIQDGYADGVDFVDQRGAGVYSEGDATLSQITFENHFSTGEGSLILNLGTNAKLTLQNCTFRFSQASPMSNILNSANAQLILEGSNTVVEQED